MVESKVRRLLEDTYQIKTKKMVIAVGEVRYGNLILIMGTLIDKDGVDYMFIIEVNIKSKSINVEVKNYLRKTEEEIEQWLNG